MTAEQTPEGERDNREQPEEPGRTLKERIQAQQQRFKQRMRELHQRDEPENPDSQPSECNH